MKTFLLTKDHSTVHLPKKVKAVGWDFFSESAKKIKNESLWVTEEFEALKKVFVSLDDKFFKHQKELRKRVKIFLIADVPMEVQKSLEGLFKEAFIIPHQWALPLEQLVEIINGKYSERYVIAGQVDQITHTIMLIRGDLSPFVVPFSAFSKGGNGIQPDFYQFSIDDFGQTLKFGVYEASVDAVLYEFDPLYRRNRKKESISKDKGLGASLRRLRLQKGLRQTDFPGIDPKEIGRIERGEVKKPRQSTLKILAKTLKVEPSEIGKF